MAQIQKIVPYLWYNNQAREAADFYCSLFKNAKVQNDTGMLVEFELEGMQFIALNGGPKFSFTEATSFLVYCDDQAEVDFLWESLISNGGREDMCGWCKDKYGLSWQIVPTRFVELIKSGNPEQTKRVFDAMLSMRKMLISKLEDAFNAPL